MNDTAGAQLVLLTLSSDHLRRALLLVWYNQGIVVGIDDDDSQ
jgi:hypothetical protein